MRLKRTVKKFYADWCGPCKAITPMLTKLAEEYEAGVEEINVETSNEAKELGVRSIPALFLYKDGELVGSRQGIANTTESNLREMFSTFYGETYDTA